MIRDAVDILLEGTPAHINIVSLREQLDHVNGVGSIHDLHVWTLTSGVMAMSCHIVAENDSYNRTEILSRVNGCREKVPHRPLHNSDRRENIPQERSIPATAILAPGTYRD